MYSEHNNRHMYYIIIRLQLCNYHIHTVNTKVGPEKVTPLRYGMDQVRAYIIIRMKTINGRAYITYIGSYDKHITNVHPLFVSVDTTEYTTRNGVQSCSKFNKRGTAYKMFFRFPGDEM